VPNESRLYEIGVRGRLGPSLERVLAGFQVVSSDAEETRLRGWVEDQDRVYGILDQLASLGLEVTSVHLVNVTP
jgi:hypothetical protein